MRITYEREISDETLCSKYDAIAYASRHPELWKIKKTKREILAEAPKTDFEGKCGGCKNATAMGKTCYVTCKLGYACRPRSQKACTKYERAKE